MRWAEELGLKLLLDLHGAPGSQNGKQTAGWDDPQWTPARFNEEVAVQVAASMLHRTMHCTEHCTMHDSYIAPCIAPCMTPTPTLHRALHSAWLMRRAVHGILC